MGHRTRREWQETDPFDPLDGQPQETLDLHGLTADEALHRVEGALGTIARKTPGALVHLITGKGKRSTNGPILLGRVRTWLKDGRFPVVVAWGRDDAEGGYLVRLRGGRWN